MDPKDPKDPKDQFTELQNTFVISIRPDRLHEFKLRMKSWHEDVNVFEGVDGRLLHTSNLIQEGVYNPPQKWHQLTRGELGCYMSHESVWKLVKDHKLPYAFIMEDDCLFQPDLHGARLRSALTELRKGDSSWKVLLLARTSGVCKNRKNVSKTFAVPDRSWGLFCYMISYNGAVELLKRSRPIEEAVDTFVSTAPIGGVYALRENLCSVSTLTSDTTGIV